MTPRTTGRDDAGPAWRIGNSLTVASCRYGIPRDGGTCQAQSERPKRVSRLKASVRCVESSG